MTSLLTNTAAQTALRTLTQTNKNLGVVQSHISTGMRVATAADNAAYWSIATTMRSDNAALSTVEDALGLGSATVDVAYTAVESAISVVSEIGKKLVAASEPGVDRAKIQKEISALQEQLSGIADAAVFSGENWLSQDSGASGYNNEKSIVSSFSRSAGSVTVGTITIDISEMKLFDADTAATTQGILDGYRDSVGAIDHTQTAASSDYQSIYEMDISTLTADSAGTATLNAYIKGVDIAIGEMTNAATKLGAVKSRIDLQKNFVTELRDAIDRGIGQLVDADMNEESTRLQALQVQAQLGVQALSIANSSSQNILALFK
jgi:flagellin